MSEETTVAQAVGQPFVGTMKVGEALRNHPKAKEIMSSFHLGGCSACSLSEEESLDEVCQGYGVNLEQLLKTLNGLL